MSLTTRALIAILLMIGFYLLALAVAGGLLWIVYAEFTYFDHINVRLTMACVIGAGVILWSIIPRRDNFEPPGPRVDPSWHPRLFAELEGIARATGQEMPRDVFLMPDVNAWVAQRGGVMGFGSHRVMALGMPLMALLTVPEFRAVIAHEFGHYHGGDTRLGPWIYKTRSAIGRTLRELGRRNSWLVAIFRWYGDMFLKITLAISRAQEYAADQIAAKLGGGAALISGLKQIHRGALAWNAYLQMEVMPVVSAGYSPPLGSGFSRFVASPTIKSQVESALEKELADGKADPFDSHPSLPERIAALQALPSSGEQDQRLAIELLDDPDSADTSVIISTTRALRPVAWDAVWEQVWLPTWRNRAASQAEALHGLTVANLPKALWSGELRQKIKNPAGTWPTTDQRVQMVQGTAACALALALLRDGWTFHMLPGESFCEKNGHRLEPFNVVPKLAKQQITQQQWTELCIETGISDLSLSAEISSGAAAAG